MMNRICFLFFLIFLALTALISDTNALMSSTNYTIFADSFSAGDIFSTGTYRLESTVGEAPVGFSTSSSYEIRGGFQAMDKNSLSLNISGASVSLGNLISSAVNSGSAIAEVTTDCANGYILAISSVSGAGLAGVTGGSVVAGITNYGFSAVGSDSLISGDIPVAIGNIASTSSAVTGSQTTLTFKASIKDSDRGSSDVSYSQVITLTASVNL